MTRRLRLIALGAALMISASPGRADEPPPDRLEKKPAPAEPKRPDAAKKPGDKADVDKDQPKAPPAEDAEMLREKIAEDMQSAEKKLKDRDAGRDTQEMQDRALRNIDKLIELARNPPPPPPMDGNPPPMRGEQHPSGGKPQSQPQSSQSRREKREQRRKQMEQQARSGGQQPRPPQPGGKEGGGEQLGKSAARPGMGGPNSARQPDQLADVVKDFWGHLPETLRQEVDHYYRDRFMPRYRDLLQEYYGRIAERERDRREDPR